MSVVRTYRAGSAVEDYCRACKTDRMHTVMAADAAGHPIRVVCGYCRSEHNYRGGASRGIRRARGRGRRRQPDSVVVTPRAQASDPGAGRSLPHRQ